MKQLLALISCIVFTYAPLKAQKGIWEVKSVMVGDRDRTPVAKWFQFNEDGTYTAGNGWTRNSAGSWSLNEKDQLSLIETVAVTEGNTPFDLVFTSNSMQWQRKEFDLLVTITLVRITDLPQSATDSVQGLWAYEKVMKDNEDITDSYNAYGNRLLFMRPDRSYRDLLGKDGRKRGYWHMNMHHSTLTIIPRDTAEMNSRWKVIFKEDHMQWVADSKANEGIVIHYKRLKQFPEE